MKKNKFFTTLLTLSLICAGGGSLTSCISDSGISETENTLNYGIGEEKLSRFTKAKSDVGSLPLISKTFVQSSTVNGQSYIRFAVAVDVTRVKRLEITRSVKDHIDKTENIVNVYKGLKTSDGGLYYNSSTGELTSNVSEWDSNYYLGSYSVKLTTDAIKASNFICNCEATSISGRSFNTIPTFASFNKTNSDTLFRVSYKDVENNEIQQGIFAQGQKAESINATVTCGKWFNGLNRYDFNSTISSDLVLNEKVDHDVTSWTPIKTPTTYCDGEEKGNCTGCGVEVKRQIPGTKLTSSEMIARINNLPKEVKLMNVDLVDRVYNECMFMDASERANVTNLSTLEELYENIHELGTSVIGPYSKDVGIKLLSGKEASIVHDSYFGNVFSIGETASWDTIQVSVPEVDDSEFDDISLLGLYINCDPVTANAIKLTLVEDFSKGGNARSTDINPECAFYNRFTKDYKEITELGMYDDLFGNPENDWHLLVLNTLRTEKVLNFIKENGYFSFSVDANNIVKAGGEVKFTSLFGFKGSKLDGNSFTYRHFSNSYSSQLPSWAAGDTINNKENKAYNVGFNCYTDDYHIKGMTYAYRSGHDETVNDYFTFYTELSNSYEVNNAYFFIYCSEEAKCQIHFGSFDNTYHNVSFSKGINRIDLTNADLSAIRGDTNGAMSFNFKDSSGNASWKPEMRFENVGSIYFVPTTSSKVYDEIANLPDHPKAMNMEEVNRVNALYENLSAEDKALVGNADKLERILLETADFVPLITPFTKGGKFEKYNGDVSVGSNKFDSTFGSVFTVSDSSDDGGQWRTFRLSSTTLDSTVLDQIGMLGIYIKTTGENHNYISMDAIAWNSKGSNKINSEQVDGARFANKNNSYDGKSIINYPIYQETFGNPGNGWELCTISAQYTKTIINELKENGEISFSPSIKIADAKGSFYVAGLFGIKANGTMPTEDLKAAYCFANAWESIDESRTGMSKNSTHGRVDPTFNRCVWPTGPAGDDKGVRLDHVYYTFTNTNTSDVDPLSGAIVYDKGATVNTTKSWSALYVYVYVKYETKVQISICGTYNNNYVTLKAGLNLVKLNDADIAVLKGKEGTVDEGTTNFKMGLAFREGAKIPSGQIIYITGIFGVPAAA